MLITVIFAPLLAKIRHYGIQLVRDVADIPPAKSAVFP